MTEFRFNSDDKYEEELINYVRRFQFESDTSKREAIKNEAFAFIDEYKSFLGENPLPVGEGCYDGKPVNRTSELVRILENMKKVAFDPQNPLPSWMLEKKVAT